MITLNEATFEYVCLVEGDESSIEKVIQEETLIFLEKIIHGKWLSRALHRGKIVLIDPRAFISQNIKNPNV